MNKRNLLLLAALGSAGVAMLSGCGGGASQSSATVQDSTATKIVEVKVEAVRKQAVEQIREYTGTISPYSKNMIASQSAMRIEQIMVEVGDAVSAGQLLVQMEQTSYLQSKLQVENLRTDYERAKSLYETGGVSKQQIDQLKTQLEVAEEALANLLKNTRLLSPITGVVTQRNFDNGDVTGGQPILQVQQLRPIKILINVQEEYFARMSTRMTADIKVDIYTGSTFTGQVNLVYPTIDNTTHTFVTELVAPNADQRLRPGMFARATLNFGSVERVVAPDKAVIKQVGTDERYVFALAEGNTVQRRIVTLGRRMGNAYEVLAGLADGEKVITAGGSKLISGDVVKVVSSLNEE
ncbi:MAG: efflux RND transporter periplasmic adaptor subunit [Prevotellaceae bacterium]|nr:efflux RND transporter periplasmic adaptor subunit [Prevotellaceae bacterium]